MRVAIVALVVALTVALTVLAPAAEARASLGPPVLLWSFKSAWNSIKESTAGCSWSNALGCAANVASATFTNTLGTGGLTGAVADTIVAPAIHGTQNFIASLATPSTDGGCTIGGGCGSTGGVPQVFVTQVQQVAAAQVSQAELCSQQIESNGNWPNGVARFRWDGGQCVAVAPSDSDQDGVPDWSDNCNGPNNVDSDADGTPDACDATPRGPCYGGYVPPGSSDCYASKEQYDITLCGNAGNYWLNGQCLTASEYCPAKYGAGSTFDGTNCVDPQSFDELCTASGYLWFDGVCYGQDGALVPRGLEGVFKFFRSEQEKALYGAYKAAIDQALNQKSDFQGQLDSLKGSLAAEYEAQIRGLTADFENRLSSARDVQPVYTVADGLAKRHAFLQQRVLAKSFVGSTYVDGSVSAMQRLVGGGTRVPDATVSYPSGFPTAVEDGSNWKVVVPVKVSFPGLRPPDGSMVFVGDEIAYTFRMNGGQPVEKTEPFDFVGGGDQPGSITVYLRSTFPKVGTRNPDVKLDVAISYHEEYTFADGSTTTLDGFKEAPAIQRTQYTSSNPVGSSGSSNQQETGMEAGPATGDSPDGADAYNWASYQSSRAKAAAQEADSKTGFGFGWIVSYWYVFAAAGVLFIAYRAGWLDRVKVVRNLRRKPEEAAAVKSPDETIDDLLEGI